jgi:hypothetical protein
VWVNLPKPDRFWKPVRFFRILEKIHNYNKELPLKRDKLLKCINPFGFPERETGLKECNELFAAAKLDTLNLAEEKKYFPAEPKETKFDWGAMQNFLSGVPKSWKN